jgi:hypothetical protein
MQANTLITDHQPMELCAETEVRDLKLRLAALLEMAHLLKLRTEFSPKLRQYIEDRIFYCEKMTAAERAQDAEDVDALAAREDEASLSRNGH